MTDTVPYYEDFAEIKKKIWSMLDNAVKDRGSPFRIPVFICGDQSDYDGRIVVLRKSDLVVPVYCYDDVQNRLFLEKKCDFYCFFRCLGVLLIAK